MRKADPVLTIDGAPRRLKLTLGALCEIEEGLGGDLSSLRARLAAPRMGDLLLILDALIAGAGPRLGVEALRAADIDFAAAARAIAASLEALGEDDAP